MSDPIRIRVKLFGFYRHALGRPELERRLSSGATVEDLWQDLTRECAHLTESEEVPTGIGEPPTPTVAPALASALYAATGQRFRQLPLLAAWDRARSA